MSFERRLSDVFLSGLPKIMKVSVANEPSGEWLANSIRFSVGDGDGSSAGSGLVVAKLSEVLFVETLRRYINEIPPDQTGWLAGTRDPMIGRALALLHADPDHAWTIADLRGMLACRGRTSRSVSVIFSTIPRCPISPNGD